MSWRGERGEWYVVVQFLLIALVVFGPAALPGTERWPDGIARWTRLAGVKILAVGAVLAVAAVLALRANLSPLPEPRAGATLVVKGPYRWARHPIYGGLVLMALGYALAFRGWLTVVSALVLFAFLNVKAAREERRLEAMFPEYRAYGARVRRMIPFIF